jgi:hypothetical protein
LAVIVYRGPVSRSELEEIRGVNCAHALRELSIRGLVARKEPARPQDTVRYAATPTLLEHLGVTDVADMPGYTAVRDEIVRYEASEEVQAQTSVGVPEATLSEEEESRTIAMEEALEDTPSQEDTSSVSDSVDDVSFVTDRTSLPEADAPLAAKTSVEEMQKEQEQHTAPAPHPEDTVQDNDARPIAPVTAENTEHTPKAADPADMRDVVRARIRVLEGVREEAESSVDAGAPSVFDSTSSDGAAPAQGGEKSAA